MADSSLPARLLAAVEQLVWSTYMVAREFPLTILPLILIAFISLVVLAVSLFAPLPKLPARSGRHRRGDETRCPPTSHWHIWPRSQPEQCPNQTAGHAYLVNIQSMTLC